MKFGLQAVITAADGKGDELANIMLKATEVVASIAGCEIYLVQQSLTDDNKVLITEVWIDKDSHALSLQNKNIQSLILKAKPLIVGMEHHPAKFIGGHGINN